LSIFFIEGILLRHKQIAGVFQGINNYIIFESCFKHPVILDFDISFNIKLNQIQVYLSISANPATLYFAEFEIPSYDYDGQGNSWLISSTFHNHSKTIQRTF